ncbi:PQQ-binding-like beta-propeller repeat protein [Gemmata sp. JC717]|uniref:PQQ-binding-like beta-propeller repeat protein n=1 Tax=Gemmata algarum TaxID=2975278 RepID=A0ABU5EQA7_9BACT|nr:PQQ-binding-like beta-propeller repeat protein [Gemmata algarum]MDY3555491.1 PQQ-binding-like beta-propeller repeat protein [Gemmata algarum]MDY3557541.1 PQQ-binding-like beta-propeller repeat protein [Gemmata algarum]
MTTNSQVKLLLTTSVCLIASAAGLVSMTSAMSVTQPQTAPAPLTPPPLPPGPTVTLAADATGELKVTAVQNGHLSGPPSFVIAADAPKGDSAPLAANGGPTDHTMFGGTLSRNMVNLKEKIAKFPTETPKWDEAEEVKKWSEEWVLWKADLGSRAYGGPTVAGGRVFVGTNNEQPRNKRDTLKDKDGIVQPVDKGILMCFEEKTGKFLWQSVHDKLPNGNVTDWPKEGLCSTPTVEGDRVYYVSNRCTIVCADVNGFANGNDGVKTEKYTDATDVDIVWEYDLIKNQDVFPHNMSAGSPLIVGDLIYSVTANGVDESHINLPSPLAPSFIAINKKDGTLAWKSNVPGKNIMHGQWSNPVYAVLDGVPTVVFPGGDGWLYGFTPDKGEVLWKFDCNPKGTVYDLGGTGNRNDFIGTPVVYEGRVYIGVGQDPEHSSGIANFYCLEPKKGKTGDISKHLEDRKKGADGKDEVGEKPNPNSCEVWRYGWEEKRKWSPRDFKFGRTMSTACIVDGIVYISELNGYIHCLDAKTGESYWQYDTKASIWGSPCYVDGKVFLAVESGDLYVFKHTPTPKKFDAVGAAQNAPNMKEARAIQKAEKAKTEKEYLIAKLEFPSAIRSTPIVANGVMYVMTENQLFALKTK